MDESVRESAKSTAGGTPSRDLVARIEEQAVGPLGNGLAAGLADVGIPWLKIFGVVGGVAAQFNPAFAVPAAVANITSLFSFTPGQGKVFENIAAILRDHEEMIDSITSPDAFSRRCEMVMRNARHEERVERQAVFANYLYNSCTTDIESGRIDLIGSIVLEMHPFEYQILAELVQIEIENTLAHRAEQVRQRASYADLVKLTYAELSALDNYPEPAADDIRMLKARTAELHRYDFANSMARGRGEAWPTSIEDVWDGYRSKAIDALPTGEAKHSTLLLDAFDRDRISIKGLEDDGLRRVGIDRLQNMGLCKRYSHGVLLTPLGVQTAIMALAPLSPVSE